MKKVIVALFLVVASILIFLPGSKGLAADKTGEALFKEHCTACHPDGGNIINPKKTLHKKDMVANKVLSEADIIAVMRNPGPGMLKFDEKTIPQKDAQAIAQYILRTFGK
jgi:cytochrome c6